MWPFSRRPDLAAIEGATPIDVTARVSSPDSVESPVSSLRAAFVRLEAIERTSARGDSHAAEELFSLGAILVGDLVALEIEEAGGSVVLPVRRAELRLSSPRSGVLPIQATIPELVPLLAGAKHGGLLCYHEHLVLSGARLRVRAVVERTTGVVASGYRSGVATRLVVRDDLAPIVLEELT